MMGSPSTEIRTALPGDANAIRDLVRAAYAKWVPVLGREPMPMKADYDKAVREHRIDLLDDGGLLAGLIEMAAQPDHLVIVNVAVAPERQGQGLGQKLLAHAEDVARQSGVNELRLYASSLFAANIALYRRLGYAIFREEPFMGGTTVHMKKGLGA